MGNCECACLSGEESKEMTATNRHFYMREYDDPNKARQVNPSAKFILMDETNEDTNENNNHLKIKSKMYVETNENDIPPINDDIYVKEEDNRIEENPQDVCGNIYEEVLENKNEEEEEEVVMAGFSKGPTIQNQKNDTFKVQTYHNMRAQETVIAKPIQETRNKNGNEREQIQTNEEAVVDSQDNTELNKNEEAVVVTQDNNTPLNKNDSIDWEDVDDDEFDCQKHSKEIFKYINEYKVNLKKLQEECKNLEIPSESTVTSENVQKIFSFIEELKAKKYRGKSMMWNEKGYNALHDNFIKRIKGEKVSMDFQEVFENANVGKTVEFGVQLKGKYSSKETALLLILKNSSNSSYFFSDFTPYCAVSYVEAKKGNTRRGFTTVAFSK